MAGDPFADLDRRPQPAATRSTAVQTKDPFADLDARKTKTKPSGWWDTAKDVFRSARSGLQKGTIGLAGLPGDIRDIQNAVSDTAAGWITGRDIRTERIRVQQAFAKRHPNVQKALNVAQSALPGMLIPFSQPMNSARAVEAVDKRMRSVGARQGLYRPQTAAGRITETTASALPGAVIGGEGLATNLAKGFVPALASGAAAGVVNEAAPDSPWLSTIASLAAGAGAGATDSLRRIRSAPQVAERAERLAGRALRESAIDPDADLARLAAHRENPPALLPGVSPTTAQVLRTPEAQRMELMAQDLGDGPYKNDARIARDASNEAVFGGSPHIGGVIPEEVPAFVPRAAEVAAPMEAPEPANLREIVGVEPGVQGSASAGAKDMMTGAAAASKARADRAWAEVGDDASLNAEPMVAELKDHVAGMSMARADNFPADLKRIMGRLGEAFGTPEANRKPVTTNLYGAEYKFDPETEQWFNVKDNQPAPKLVGDALTRDYIQQAPPVPAAPLREWQDLRSRALEDARALDRDGRYSGDLKEFAAIIGRHLEDPKNFTFGNEEAGAAWRNAVTATREHKQAFGSGFTKEAVARDPSGSPKIAPEALFDKMLGGGSNAIKSLRQARATPGIDTGRLDNAISDYMIGRLTRNGADLNLSPAQIDRFMADPKFAPIIDEVPGLRERITNYGSAVRGNIDAADSAAIAARAEAERVKLANREISEANKTGERAVVDANKARGNLVDAAKGLEQKLEAGNPQQLANYLDKNDEALRAGMAPEQQGYLEELRNSAKLVQNVAAGKLNNRETMDALADGSILTLLTGRATGAVSNAVAFEIVSQAMQSALNGSAPGVGAVAGALVGASRGRVGSFLRRGASGAILGGTRDDAVQTLQRAMADPELAEALMRKPTPEAIISAGKALEKAGKLGVYAAIRPEQEPPIDSEPVDDGFSVLDNNYDVPIMEPDAGSVLENDYDVPVIDGRPQRAAGGRVDFNRMVNGLMNQASRAKNQSNTLTQPLLGASDDSIAHALSIAQRAI